MNLKNINDKDTFIDDDGDLVIDSPTIAKLTGKRHDSILCATDGLLKYLEDIDSQGYNNVKIKPIVPEDPSGQFAFNLNMKAVDLLINGF